MFADVVAELAALDDAALTERFREVELVARRAAAEVAAAVGEIDRRGL